MRSLSCPTGPQRSYAFLPLVALIALLACALPARAQVDLGRLSADTPIEHEGQLEAGDDTLASGGYSDAFDVTVETSQALRVEVMTKTVHQHLMVVSPTADTTTDDTFTLYSSRVVVPVREGGRYRLVVATKQSGETGPYTLKVQAVSRRAVAAHDADQEELRRAKTHYDSLLVHFQAGRYGDALASARSVARITQTVLGPDDPFAARSLNDLAMLLNRENKFAEAERRSREALAVQESTLGAKHPDTAVTLSTLATVLNEQGRYGEAEPLHRQVLEIHEQALGPDHRYVAIGLSNVAEVLVQQGRFNEAEPLYRQALTIYEAQTKGANPNTATVLRGLTNVLRHQGRFEEAEAALRRALSIEEAALGPDHPSTATTLDGLGYLAERRGDLDEAETLYRRSLAIYDAALGAKNTQSAHVLRNLALLLDARDRHEEAERLILRGLSAYESTLGAQHPMTAYYQATLAQNMLYQGHVERGIELSGDALAVLNRSPGHPGWRADVYALHARLHRAIGQQEAALNNLDEALHIIEAMRPEVGGGEATRASFFAEYAWYYDRMAGWQLDAGDVDAAFAYVERSRSRALLDQLATTRVDLREGIPLDVLAPLEAQEREAQRRMASYRQRTARVRAGELRTGEPGAEADRTARLEALQDSLDAATRAYQQVYADIKNASPLWSEQLTAGGQTVSLREARQQLVPREGLMLVYHVDTDTAFVFVVPPEGTTAAPEALPLTLGEEDAAVLGVEAGPLTRVRLRQILAPADTDGTAALLGGVLDALGTRPVDGTTAQAQHRDLTARLHALWHALVPGDLWPRLTGAAEIVVVPDSELSGLPFEALVAVPGPVPSTTRYWLDDGPPVRYAPSATTLQALTRRPAAPPRVDAATVLSVADPIYDPAEVEARRLSPKPRLAERQGAGGDQTRVWVEEMETDAEGVEEGGIEEGGTEEAGDGGALLAVNPRPTTRGAYEGAGGMLTRLPGTDREADAIVAAYGPDAGGVVHTLRELQASEPAVRAAVPGVRYLHLATHGLVDESRGSLFASLALTPPVTTDSLANDGFLELHEIYDLDLSAAELAVLSACQSNVGRQVEGEGVFALSRGFLAAGALRVIASQWAVDDASTGALVGAFFEAVAQAETHGEAVPYARALQAAQRQVRAESAWAAPYHWAPFVLIGRE